MPHARTVMERIAALALISEHPEYLLRRSYTTAMQTANAAVARWMEEVGMTVHHDYVGNLVGRYAADDPDAPMFIFGSHLDTVRDAGAFDGPLGILLALAAVERLHQSDVRLPFHIDIIAFSDEEGVRWGTAYLGSKAVAGTFDPADLVRQDDDGIAVADAIRMFGGVPERIAEDRHDRARVLGYCEAHIEQGPVLEAHDLAVGIVDAIAGQSRFTLQFMGEAGHAGTVPMLLRHDALCAAAEFVLAAEALGRATPGLVSTVGQLAIKAAAGNVIPANVTFSLDVRHPDDEVRLEACGTLHDQMRGIAQARDIGYDWQLVHQVAAVACDTHLTAMLASVVADMDIEPLHLSSGAGHDAAAIAALAPVAMLFVRCAGGVSHNPAESVMERDVAVAIDVLIRFIRLLPATQGASA